MTRLTISVNDEEFVRLVQMANQELRHPRDQARLILRKALFGTPAELPNASTNNNSDVTTLAGSHVAVAS